MIPSMFFTAASLFVNTQNTVPAQGEPGDYLSPDRKYIAHVAYNTASLDMWIYRAGANRKRLPRSKPVLEETFDVDGIAWVPGRAHTLVFATSSIYGTAALGLWHGGGHFRQLVKVRHPDKENFQLRTISRDGRTITYLHGLYENQQEDTYLHRSLKLPKP